MTTIEALPLKFNINLDHAGIRLDLYLVKQLSSISRAQIKHLITDGKLTLNNAATNKKFVSYTLKVGDEIIINSLTTPASNTEPKANDNIDFSIAYEDEHLLVVNKPAGLTVHPGAGNHQNTLVNGLLAKNFRLSDSTGDDDTRPGIVHRLDKDTSGLMLVAKNNQSHQHLAAQLKARTIKRVYLALVYGLVQPAIGAIEKNIARSKTNYQKMQAVEIGGKTAKTNYELLQNFTNFASLVRVKLDTGRTHQIRVHFADIGHGLIGDATYGKRPKILNLSPDVKDAIANFGRQALHATEISFAHPHTNKEISFSVDMPKDMAELESVLAKKFNNN